VVGTRGLPDGQRNRNIRLPFLRASLFSSPSLPCPKYSASNPHLQVTNKGQIQRPPRTNSQQRHIRLFVFRQVEGQLNLSNFFPLLSPHFPFFPFTEPPSLGSLFPTLSSSSTLIRHHHRHRPRLFFFTQQLCQESRETIPHQHNSFFCRRLSLRS
jgi:hypothetical protein